MIPASAFTPLGLVLSFLLLGFAWAGASFADDNYEGFGSRTIGGAGGKVLWVDPRLGDPQTDAHAGTERDPCSLRKALSGPKRIIKFTRGGTITLRDDIQVTDSFITIDGASTPAPGVTITHTQQRHGGIVVKSYSGDVSDIIIRHLRFVGLWKEYPIHRVGWRLLSFYAGKGDGGTISNVVLDHVSMRGLQDKTTFWGSVENVTVSWCFFHDSHMATLVSFYGRPFDLKRKGLSFHHNLYARSSQRNPQLRGWIEDFDYVNNIVYGWKFYGMRIKNEPGEKSINANVINNLFCSTGVKSSSALIYGWDPGPDYAEIGPVEPLGQGAVYAAGNMGRLYVAGNILPAGNRDQYSTILGPLEIPDWAKVTTWPAEELPQRILDQVGMQYRDEREKQLLAEVKMVLTDGGD